MYTFVALRFIEDENISDRVYWYLTGIPLSVGDLALAPVGTRSRLQLARTECAFSGEAQDAPYDIRFLKRVEAKLNQRKLVFGETVFCELGGVRYDMKRYTRFRKILFTECVAPFPREAEEGLRAYGVIKTLCADSEEVFKKLAESAGCVLLYGARAAEQASAVVKCVRGEDCGIEEGIAEKIRRRLR